MVIVLSGPTSPRTKATGQALASAMGWPLVENHAPRATGTGATNPRRPLEPVMNREARLLAQRKVVEEFANRREAAVVLSPVLDEPDRRRLSAGIRGIRFVHLRAAHPADQQTPIEQFEKGFAIDAAKDLPTIVGRMRLEFGL